MKFIKGHKGSYALPLFKGMTKEVFFLNYRKKFYFLEKKWEEIQEALQEEAEPEKKQEVKKIVEKKVDKKGAE